MSARSFVYKTIVSTPGVLELIGEDNPRVFAKKTMTSSVEVHPYIVYKLGNETPSFQSEEWEASGQFFQIWVHDESDKDVADYERIDTVIAALREAFWLKNSAEEEVWTTTWVETSQDLDDDTLKTVFKYVRFQMIRRSQ